MSDSLKREGFMIIATGKAVHEIGGQHKRQVAARLMVYDKPKGFIPGATHDNSKGYAIGSEIGTKGGKFFKCVSAEQGKAVWVQLSGSITPGSFYEDNLDVVPVKTNTEAETKVEVVAEVQDKQEDKPAPETDKKDVPQATQTQGFDIPGSHEEGFEPFSEKDVPQEQAQAVVNLADEKSKQQDQEHPPEQTLSLKGDLFEDLPYRTFLLKDGITTLQELTEVIDKGELASVKRMHSKAAERVKEWLAKNDLL